MEILLIALWTAWMLGLLILLVLSYSFYITERDGKADTLALANAIAETNQLIDNSSCRNCQRALEHLEKSEECYDQALEFLRTRKFRRAETTAEHGLMLVELAKALCGIKSEDDQTPA